MLCSRVAQVEHGQCPAPRALPGEDRCELIGPYNKSRDLVFTYERYMYGELTIVKDGTLSPLLPRTRHDTLSVFVLVAGVWRGKPDNKFGEFECGEQADYRWLTPGPGAAGLPEPTQSFKKLVVMMPPVTGGAYFQHFIDRGWTKLMQVWYAFASWCQSRHTSGPRTHSVTGCVAYSPLLG
jgi:hypothetical protein